MYRAFLFFNLVLLACTAQKVSYQPSAASTVYSPQYNYIVKKGESLWAIAKAHEVTVADLIKINNISAASELKAGQSLKIPYRSPETVNLSFTWPVKGRVVNAFGESVNNTVNKGLNIKVSATENVLATEDGKVIYAASIKGWGKTIIVKHRGNFYSIYANLYEILVKETLAVRKGEIIGRVSLRSPDTAEIFHFEIRKGHLADNPLKYLGPS
jgi:murein DD-endopeptidase MepM/ murein hydrolase activator NlpD